MRVAIVGAGGIGTYVGAHLMKAGADLVLIDQFPEHVERCRNEGLALSGMLPRDNFTIRLPMLHISEVQGLSKQRPIDAAFVAVKSYDTAWAAELIRPYLAPAGFCISLQNGINEETIAGVAGWGKTAGIAIAGLGVELFAPGHVKRTQVGREGHVVFRAGEVHGRTTERIEAVARAIGVADLSKVTTNLWGERWSKLIGNAMRNGLSAVTNMSGPEQDSSELARDIMIRLGSETVRVGKAYGYELVTTNGMEPETLARAGEGDAAAFDEITRTIVGLTQRRGDDNRPSMAQDIAKGRRTEIEQMNGMIAERGARIGVPAPVNARMCELVKAVERGELAPGVAAMQSFQLPR